MQKGLAPILIILLIAILGVGGYFIYQKQASKPSTAPQATQSSPTPPANTDETGNWKTYKDSNGFFTIEYPYNWKISYSNSVNLDDSTWKGKQDVTFTGSEGKIALWWVDSYGGGCDNWEKIQIANKKYDVCHVLEHYKTGSEAWTNITNKFNSKSNFGVQVEAFINKPTLNNRETVLKVLQSINFSDAQFK